MKYRTEFDSIGKIRVPGDKYWGASTERSKKYFNIGDFYVRSIVIHSIAIIKKAAAPESELLQLHIELLQNQLEEDVP